MASNRTRRRGDAETRRQGEDLPDGALPEGAHEVVTPEAEPVAGEPEPEPGPVRPVQPVALRRRERWPLGRWGYRK